MEALYLHARTGAAAEGRGMDHLLISCGSCHDDLRSPTFYEAPHDIRHRQAGPWPVVLDPLRPLGE